MESIIIRRYARAYFELAQERNMQETFSADSAFLQRTFEDNPELYQLLSAPEVTVEHKEASVERIFAGSCSMQTLGLVKLLIRKGRVGGIAEILREYDRMAREAMGEITAYVRTAQALSERQQDRIRQVLEKKLDRKVTLNVTVDESLIGGMVVRLGDQLYDNSIRSRMEKLRVHLQQVRLEDAEKVG